MPVLVGLVTYLTLAGTPGVPETFVAKTEDTSARPSGNYTALSLNGGAGRIQTFTAKAESFENAFGLTDRYVLTLTMGDVTDVDIDVTDTYVLTLGMSAYAGLSRAVADSYVPLLNFSVSALDKSALISKAGSDSYVPVLTMTSTSVTYQKAGADSYIPVLTMTATADTSAGVTVSDSYIPVLDMSFGLQTAIGAVSRGVSDRYVLNLTLTASPKTSGEVDAILITSRPYGYIRIEEA